METFKTYQPEFVFHLAAQPRVRLSYDEPKMTFDTNVRGTVNVFEGVRKTPSVKVLVNITSDTCLILAMVNGSSICSICQRPPLLAATDPAAGRDQPRGVARRVASRHHSPLRAIRNRARRQRMQRPPLLLTTDHRQLTSGL